MAICDEQKAYHIINKYGSKEEKDALDKLRSLIWNEKNSIIDDMLKNWSLDTANCLQADHKGESGDWFMEDD